MKREFIPIYQDSTIIGYEDLDTLTGIRMDERTNEDGNIFLDIVATTNDARKVLLAYCAGFAVNKTEGPEAFEDATARLNSFLWKLKGSDGVDPWEIHYFVKIGIVKAENVHPSMSMNQWREMLRVG